MNEESKTSGGEMSLLGGILEIIEVLAVSAAALAAVFLIFEAITGGIVKHDKETDE